MIYSEAKIAIISGLKVIKLHLVTRTFPSVLLAFFILSLPVKSAPLEGILLAETDSNQSDLTKAQPLGMFAVLLDHREERFNFTQQQASYSRSWSDLNKLGNACMYNKFKSAEREQVSYFSQKPITVYPPLRFIILKKNLHLFPDIIDFKNLPPSMKGNVGVVTARSYGDNLNPIIAEHPEYFYFRSGMNSTNKLLEMLAKERVVGILEYSAEVGFIKHKIGMAFEHYAIPIKGVLQPNYGYIACSKTPMGRQLVDSIDTVMSQPSFIQAFIDEHNRNFDEDEKALIKPEFDKLLKSEPSLPQ
ncbi:MULTISPECIES: hypothetical protein [Pseudomonadati]|uniref:Transporter substrate-binding domain-containing protein n=1 Tax=Shewanella aestuarii TaxID=1028752 RepID=A0ABT0L0T7_9GAMM|nr:hypothetical protein [Shewanella aestuarii]MCL1117317.1 hypothetical protein [Shewanella aestuarii]GGN74642.1 hypothetical protein GCM10009193_13920 [Shewanella aestuarii]